MPNLALNFELKRKTFHLCSLVFPLAYAFTNKMTMCILLTIIAGFTLYIDISRHYNIKIKMFVEKVLGQFLRKNEQSGQFALSGSSYMILGFLLSCIFFSKGLAITSWLILIISDCFAAIIGMKYGSPLFSENGKSLAGFVSFFASAFFISIMMYFTVGYSTTFVIIIVSSFITACVEFFSDQIKIDDNFSIPVTYALTTSLLRLMA
jgi:dolichol kinase